LGARSKPRPEAKKGRWCGGKFKPISAKSLRVCSKTGPLALSGAGDLAVPGGRVQSPNKLTHCPPGGEEFQTGGQKKREIEINIPWQKGFQSWGKRAENFKGFGPKSGIFRGWAPGRGTADEGFLGARGGVWFFWGGGQRFKKGDVKFLGGGLYPWGRAEEGGFPHHRPVEPNKAQLFRGVMYKFSVWADAHWMLLRGGGIPRERGG